MNATEDKILTFIGLNFLMGYHILPKLENYWSSASDLKVEMVPETMSRNRFLDIPSNLHLNDNSLIPKDNTDQLYKVRPFVETLIIQFCDSATGSIDDPKNGGAEFFGAV